MRTQSPETQEAADLIRDLVRSYTCEPESLTLEVKEHPARVEWVLQGSPTDTPLLVGTRGSHIKALQALVREMGRVAGKMYKLTLLDPEPGECRELEDKVRAEAWDSEPSRLLLERTLMLLGVDEFRVEAQPMAMQDSHLRFELGIYLRSADARTALRVPADIRGPSMVEAIGTLFRAAANISGIRIQIQLK